MTESISDHNLRTRFFLHMHFSQNVKGSSVLPFYIISGQNQSIDFPKKSKAPFLDHFWPFLMILLEGGFSKKKLSFFTYGPLTLYKVSEKTNETIPRQKTETEGQTLIHRILLAMARGSNKERKKLSFQKKTEIFRYTTNYTTNIL